VVKIKHYFEWFASEKIVNRRYTIAAFVLTKLIKIIRDLRPQDREGGEMRLVAAASFRVWDGFQGNDARAKVDAGRLAA